MFTVELIGADKVKNMFKDIGFELSAGQFRQVLDEGGRVIVNEAKQQMDYPGVIGEPLKRDLGVYRDRRPSAKNAEFVIVGPRFKPYSINGQTKKAALVAQHWTVAFHQTDRMTKAGKRRGRVRSSFLVANPVLGAFRSKKSELNAAFQKGVDKRVNKIKQKYGL